MKKQISRKTIVLIAIPLLISAFCLAGCSKYTSSYKAVAFVHSNSSGSAFMNFYEFEGTLVFRLKNNNAADGRISYSGKLETGSITVFYDCGDTKTELFSISGGEEAESAIDLSEKGPVYIIVESSGKCQNGEFHFEIQ